MTWVVMKSFLAVGLPFRSRMVGTCISPGRLQVFLPSFLDVGSNVIVRFCTDGLTENGFPTEDKVAEVQAHIELNDPIPASITVVAPQAQVVNFTISDLLPSNDTIKENIKAEL